MGDTWLEGIMQKQSMAEKPTLGGQLPDQALEVLTARKRISDLEAALAKSASREAVLVEALNAFPERTDHPRFMIEHLKATIKRQAALAKIKEAS